MHNIFVSYSRDNLVQVKAIKKEIEATTGAFLCGAFAFLYSSFGYLMEHRSRFVMNSHDLQAFFESEEIIQIKVAS